MSYRTRSAGLVAALLMLSTAVLAGMTISQSAAVQAAPARSTVGVYPGYNGGDRFAAHEQQLKATVSWVVVMAGRKSPGDMRSSVWGQFVSPSAFLPSVSDRVDVSLAVPLAFGTRTAKTAADRQAIGRDLRDVAAGVFDNDYRTVARSLVQSGYGDALIRLGHEFDGDYYSWSARDNEANYVAAFRHVHDVFRSESKDFRFEWTGMRTTFSRFAPQAYPGDAYVDVVGLDIYYRDPAPLTNTVWTKQYLPALQFHRDFAIAHGKPVSYSEWGVGKYDNAEYVDLMHGWFGGLPTSGPGALLYQSYFNSPNADHDLGRYPKSRDRYFTLFGRGGGTAVAPPATQPPAELTQPATPVTTPSAPTRNAPAVPVTTLPSPTPTASASSSTSTKLQISATALARGFTATAGVSGATQYQFRYKLATAQQWTWDQTRANTVTVTGLVSGKKYDVEVRAYVNKKWQTVWTSTVVTPTK